MAKRVKLYEKKQQGPRIPLWGWILAVVIVITLLVLFFSHRKEGLVTQPAVTPVSSLQILPDTLFARDGVEQSEPAVDHLPAAAG